jgi:hypothetical protein
MGADGMRRDVTAARHIPVGELSRRRSPQPIKMRGAGGPTVDARAASPPDGAEHSMAAFPGRSHPGPGQILASGMPAEHASAGAGPLLPADPVRGPLPCCLCTNVWMTCAQRCPACAYAVEMLGIPLPGRHQNRAFTWESASRILCMRRKLELST